MELGISDWLIIVGVLLISVVLLDGFRRVRNERRGKIRMSLNKQFLNANGPDEEHSSELPNGGARVVARNRGHANSDLEQGPAFGDGQLDLEQSVPMLMESVESESSLAADADQEDDLFSAPEEHSAVDQSGSNTSSLADAHNSSHSSSQTGASSASLDKEVVVINVVSKSGMFKGPDLLHILLACDLRFGDMSIFHRYERANGVGPIQFSMANSVEPGTFDLDAIETFSTSGVCFFLSVPGPEDPNTAFEYMVETAQCLVTNLDGEMLDESRSAMTNQTLEHCRQRIKDFERRQLTQHA